MIAFPGFAADLAETYEVRAPCGCFIRAVRRDIRADWRIVGGGHCLAHRPAVMLASEEDIRGLG